METVTDVALERRSLGGRPVDHLHRDRDRRNGSGRPPGRSSSATARTALGAVNLATDGTATLTSTLAAGAHSITAAYLGTAKYTESDDRSTCRSTRVVDLSHLQLRPSTVGADVTFTATVTAAGGPATVGSVRFSKRHRIRERPRSTRLARLSGRPTRRGHAHYRRDVRRHARGRRQRRQPGPGCESGGFVDVGHLEPNSVDVRPAGRIQGNRQRGPCGRRARLRRHCRVP